VSNTITQLLPSGGDFATCAVPMLPEAPGLFSMMMVVLSRCCRLHHARDRFGRAAGRERNDDPSEFARRGLREGGFSKRQRGSARGQMQEFAAGKFHGVPSQE
jgi:hypothetical protein